MHPRDDDPFEGTNHGVTEGRLNRIREFVDAGQAQIPSSFAASRQDITGRQEAPGRQAFGRGFETITFVIALLAMIGLCAGLAIGVLSWLGNIAH